MKKPLNFLLAGLPEDDFARLEPFLEPVRLKNRQVLAVRGEPIEAVWFPDDAITSTVVSTPDGEVIEVGLMGLDGMVGVSLAMGATVSNTTVLVQVPGTGHRMDAEHYREHVVRPQAVLYGRTQRYIDAFMSMVAQVGACNRLHDVEHRLARWLLMVHDRLGRDTFALTQEFLSMMLGVRRASVTVAAGILQHAGLIKLSRGTFFIPSHDLLAEAACGCYEVLRKDFAVLRRAELGLPPEGDIERRPLPRIANLSPAES